MSEEVVFHIKSKFKLHGFSMYDLIISECKIEDTQFIDINSLVTKWKYPILSDIKTKMEDEYCLKLRLGAILSLYKNGESYEPYSAIDYKGDGLFMLFFGCHRLLLTKNKKSNIVTKYTVGDGDLIYFNKTFKNENIVSIPKIKNITESMLAISLFF